MDFSKVKEQNMAIVRASIISKDEAIRIKGKDHYIILMNLPVYKAHWINTEECTGGSMYQISLLSTSGESIDEFDIDDIHVYGFSKEHTVTGISPWKHYTTADSEIFVGKGYKHASYIYMHKDTLDNILPKSSRGIVKSISLEIISAP